MKPSADKSISMLNKAVMWTFVYVVLAGFVLPWMISSDHTELVLLGFCIAAVVAYIAIVKVIKFVFTTIGKEEDR